MDLQTEPREMCDRAPVCTRVNFAADVTGDRGLFEMGRGDRGPCAFTRLRAHGALDGVSGRHRLPSLGSFRCPTAVTCLPSGSTFDDGARPPCLTPSPEMGHSLRPSSSLADEAFFMCLIPSLWDAIKSLFMWWYRVCHRV